MIYPWKQLARLQSDLLKAATTRSQEKLIGKFFTQAFGYSTRLTLDAEDVSVSGQTANSSLMEQREDVPSNDELMFPIKSGTRHFGFITFKSQGPHIISKKDRQAIGSVLTQIASTLEIKSALFTNQRQAKQLELVRNVSAQIVDLLDIDLLARRVVRLISKSFSYYYVAVFSLEQEQQRLFLRSSSSSAKSQKSSTRSIEPLLYVEMGEGIIGLAASKGTEFLSNDVAHDSNYRHINALPLTQSEIALPLMVQDRVFGVLDIQSTRKNAFQATDVLILRSLADYIATALFNITLHKDILDRAKQLATVAEIGRKLASILELDELLLEVVNVIHRRFKYPYVHIFSVHPARRKIIYEAGSRPSNKRLKSMDLMFDLDDPSGLIPFVSRTREPLLCNDITLEPRYQAFPPLQDEPIRSELVIPLIFGGDLLGILDVQSDRKHAFTAEDQFFLEALGDNIAIALRNATLYHSELWRRQVADSMHQVAGLLSADIALNQVLDLILTELEKTLPCDTVALWLVETSNSDMDPRTTKLQLAAVHVKPGKKTSQKSPKPRMTAEEIALVQSLDPKPVNWLLQALEAENPLIRTPSSPAEPLGIIQSFPSDYSAIAAPLRISDQILGLLTLLHRDPGRYGTESQIMTATFATYAAVAIENTRLYEAAHDQAWISTVLLQVSEATQSLDNLDDLLGTMVRLTPGLTGVTACAALIWDPNIEVFLPAASYGLNVEQVASFDRWRIHPQDFQAFSELYSTHRPVLFNPENSGFQGSLHDDNSSHGKNWFAAFQEVINTLVLFPMLAHDEIIGAFLINYNLAREDALWDDKLAIIQGIAHQTAVAVENIQLLRAQKEEAYVSIALLQVARAVVSFTDLDEILEAIVRITPILVGVKRCLVFLRDGEQDCFHLAEYYGLSRQETNSLQPKISSTDFFFLDTALKTNRIVYSPLISDTENIIDWASLGASFFQPLNDSLFEETYNKDDFLFSTSQLSQDFISSVSRLLIAFPLSVKTNVLGVMLVEEGEPGGGVRLEQVRGKRLEILTGITQQAALAIQNDQLQQELVMRERLERELQLAHDIQSAFLPEQLPQRVGYELASYWSPARQVGGDFFDVLELSNHRLGLVIADVADKGMPAALFMTLVRTLIRATAQEDKSPARTLERVNDLLFPDARNSMFVTVTYLILDPEDGHLVYSNAGHNLPIIVHGRTSAPISLPRCGMALGIFPDIHLDEYTYQMAHGDTLLMYTDGVTETTSASGELFGEERLIEILAAHSSKQINQLITLIRENLANFSGGAPPFDDLTLLAIHRLHA